MANETFDVDAAAKAGYSPAEIADYLGQQNGFDVAGARKSGYSDAEIISHLAPPPAPKSIGQRSREMSERAYRYVVGDDPMRQFALGSRNLAQGVLTPISMVMDLPTQIRNAVLRERNQLPSASFDEALTAAGAPVPQNKSEEMQGAITRGTASSLAFAAMGGAKPNLGAPSQALYGPGSVTSGAIPTGIPTGLGTAARAGALGAGTSEYLRQQGYPWWAQLLGGVVAPMGADMAYMMGKGVYQTMMPRGAGGASPYTESGREMAAGNVLARNTTAPAAVVQKLEGDPTIVPGTVARTAQVADDPGLAKLDKLLQTTRGSYAADVQNMEGQSNRVLRETMDSIVPQEAADKASNAAKALTAARNEMVKGAPNVTKDAANNLVKKIDDLMDSKLAVSDENVRPALEMVRKKLFDSNGNLITDADRLDGVRQYISKLIAGNFDEPGKAYSKANVALHDMLEGVKGSIDQALSTLPKQWRDAGYKQGAPYTESLRKTSEALQPVEQRGVIGQLLERASSKADIMPGGAGATGENYRVVLSQLNKQLQSERMASKVDRVLTDDQLERVSAVVKELERGARLTSMQKNRLGSDTMQNLSSAALFGRILGIDLPPEALAKAPDYVQKTLGWIANLGKGPQEKITVLVEEAMKNPKLAAELLKKAPAANLETLGEAFGRKAREYGTAPAPSMGRGSE